MTTVAISDAARSARRVPMLALLLLGSTSALLVAWLAPTGTALPGRLAMMVLVLVPTLAGAWLMRRPHTPPAPADAAAHSGASPADPSDAAQALQRARRDLDALVAALEMLPIGLAIFDSRDRRVLHNQFLDQLIPGLARQPHAPYTQLLECEHALGVRVDSTHAAAADGDAPDTAKVLQYPGDRWIQSLVVRSADGLAIVARVDVTDLVRAEHLAAADNAQLTLQSATDGLTGITNRRRFDELLRVEWQRAARAHTCLSMLIVDIDHFKRFNDHYGHVAGDECLRQVAALLQSCVRRAGELVARYGGEEFVVLLPGAEAPQAEELARRCLDGIAAAALPHASSPSADHVSFSIGIAHVVPSASGDPADLVNAADTAMYRAKMAGRARYAVADQADWQIDKDAPRSTVGDLH